METPSQCDRCGFIVERTPKPENRLKLKWLFAMAAMPLLLVVPLPSLAALSSARLFAVQAPLSTPRDSTNLSPSSPFLSSPSPVTLPPSLSPAPPPLSSPPNQQLRSPAVVIGCNAGGCLDSSGNWYPGAGGVYLNKDGMGCARTGVWLQCN
jgi:hypothetical protein